MRVYGSPERLYAKSLAFFRIAEHLQDDTDQERIAQMAYEALQHIRTAIIHNAPSRARRNHLAGSLRFTLAEWQMFKADAQYKNNKKVILRLIRTLRRIQKRLPVALNDQISVIKFFERLSDECVRKGDASRMKIEQ